MDTGSAAATIWQAFWTTYLAETFGPWWKSRSVRVDMSEVTDALGQDLETWTLHDPSNRAFSAPGVGSRDAAAAQLTAFRHAVAQLAKQLGGDPKTWAWGRVHKRVLSNLAQVTGLDYGPRAERGDANTPLAAGGLVSHDGPSWRMVVDWGTQTFLGVYPGGQGENPASSWYTNRVDGWFAGRLDPMLTADQAGSSRGATTWSMHP
jgi:penicillin amidase